MTVVIKEDEMKLFNKKPKVEVPDSPAKLDVMTKAARNRALTLAYSAIYKAHKENRLIINDKQWEYTDKQGVSTRYSDDDLATMFWNKLNDELMTHSMGGYTANFGVLGITVNDILNIILKIKNGG